METTKDGELVNKAPILDGTYYDYWKVMMMTFLKSLGNKGWKVVIKEWKHLMITSKDGTTSQKLETDCTDSEDDEALEKSKLLNEISDGMDKNTFRLINTGSEAKEASEILKTAHEGTSKVYMSILQLLIVVARLYYLIILLLALLLSSTSLFRFVESPS